jgi:hypothetical protein
MAYFSTVPVLFGYWFGKESVMQYRVKLAGLAALLISGMSLMAGGIAVEILRPSHPEAQAKKAVLVVRGYACVQPNETAIKASAEGIINGKRQTIPLKLIPLPGQSTFALTRQWPADGRWIIALTASNPKFGLTPGAIVKVEGDSAGFDDVTHFSHSPTREEIRAALEMQSLAAR